MQMLKNVPLSQYSTMRLGGPADYLATIRNTEELVEALEWADEQNLPVMMIGGGSNIIWRDEGFRGLVLVNAIEQFEMQRQENGSFLVTIGAGENWDQSVARTVEQGLSGVEALSLIPGTAGGTPVQNVGAYGQEIAQTLVSVEAYDRQAKNVVTIPATDCNFGYRSSRFKTTDKGRFFILSLTLALTKTNPTPPFYGALERYFAEAGITDYTPVAVREAVITIRQSKLPDPALVANNGSFFANPVIPAEQFKQLQTSHPDVPNWPMSDGSIKIPAAWLLEQAGFKDYHDAETGMATYAKQPLVLVNEHATSTTQLIAFRDRITSTIYDKFGISLEQEPEILP